MREDFSDLSDPSGPGLKRVSPAELLVMLFPA